MVFATNQSFNEARLARLLAIVDHIGEKTGHNVPPVVKIGELRDLPDGTLGRTLADFLDQHQLTPFTTGPRRKQLHDSVHVLAGYGTDSIGEAEVQAFLLGAKFNPSHILLGLGILRLIHRQFSHLPRSLWHQLWIAYCRGCTSTLDIDAWRPEDQWHLPLDQIQASYGL